MEEIPAGDEISFPHKNSSNWEILTEERTVLHVTSSQTNSPEFHDWSNDAEYGGRIN